MNHDFKDICQGTLPLEPWVETRFSRLPGINPLSGDQWLLRDDAYGRQMAYRDHLVHNQRGDVFTCLPVADTAAAELLDDVLASLARDAEYRISARSVIRPDGKEIAIGHEHPLVTAGRLVQEDWCLMMPPEDGDGEYWLAGAILCFPASWSLKEKIGRPLTGIHEPVPQYDDRIARSVQRIFSMLQPGRTVFRANYLRYNDPDLHQPRPEGNPRDRTPAESRMWARVERQTLRKLARSGCVVFGIQTSVCPRHSVPNWDLAWPDLANAGQ